jgi:hypothetical protein
MRVQIQRIKDNGVQTIGDLNIYGFGFNNYFSCKTLELPDKNNQQNISRIPAGIYMCRKRWSLKFGKHIIIENVHDRTYILIHAGNFFFNSTGCILVGSEFKDINNDGNVDILNSNKTLKEMLRILPDNFELQIFDEVK